MSALREAVVLPALFLTVTMFGGVEPGAPHPWAPPSLFSLVLALVTIGVLARSGTFVPDRLLHGSRSILANANGMIVLLSLFAATAQVMHMLTPRSGLPAFIVAVVLFLLLVNTFVVAPDPPRVMRSLGVILGSAFLLKFVILAALADPEGSRTRRALVTLLDVATLGTLTQAPMHPSAGYIAFFLVLLYLAGVSALPRGASHIISGPLAPIGQEGRLRIR